MKFFNSKKNADLAAASAATAVEVAKKVDEAVKHLQSNGLINNEASLRARLTSAISGGYDFADTLHDVYIDYGYPLRVDFFNFWNMYRRFGIAKNVVELPPNTGWMSPPVVEGSDQFNAELEKIIEDKNLWQRMKGVDTRQRVGRYAGLFMRVKDNRKPHEPLDGDLSGIASLVQIIPLYESQLRVLDTEDDPLSENFGMPTMYQFSGGEVGDRNEKNATAFDIHPSRVVIASENADDGSIYGFSSLEAPFNSLMDLRKILGGGGEGYYKNAAQSVIFTLADATAFKGNEKALAKFNDQYDEFTRNRTRRAIVSPGLEANVLESNLANPKDFFTNSLNDVAASVPTPTTILIGQQTGRLASTEDSRAWLSVMNSRRQNFQNELVRNTIDWFIKHGILPVSEYTVEWDDLLALSDSERLLNAKTLAEINQSQMLAGRGTVFEPEEIREAAGMVPLEDGALSEELPDESDMAGLDVDVESGQN